MQSRKFVEGVIANHALFRDVAPADVVSLARQAIALDARRGDLVARCGEPVPGLFIAGFGLAKLALGQPPHDRVLRLVGAGQAFGAAPALLGRALPYQVVALRDSKFAVVPGPALLALLERNATFARTLAAALAERSIELVAELDAASLKDGAQRLAAYLRGLAGAERVVRLPVSKTLIAARLGIQKATLSRLLGRFAAQGLIEVAGRDITLLDRERLDRLAG